MQFKTTSRENYGNSKCRVLVFSHVVLNRFFDPSVPTAHYSQSRFTGVVETRRSAIMAEIQANPQNFVNRVFKSSDYPALDISNDVIGLSFSKMISAPAGQLTISITPRTHYLRDLNADDVILVELDNGAGEFDSSGLVTIALIDRISTKRTAEGNFATKDDITLHCRDLGKVLLETSVSADMNHMFMAEMGQKWTEQGGLFVGNENQFNGSPSEIVTRIFKTYSQLRLKKHGLKMTFMEEGDLGAVYTFKPVQPIYQFVFPGNVGVNLAEMIDIESFVSTDTIGGLVGVVIPRAGQTLWHLMDQFSNRIVNEMFVDVREASSTDARGVQYTFALIMRQMPFDKDAFERLPLTKIQDTEVQEYDLGKSSQNVRNVFQTWLFGHGLPSLADQGWPLLLALESVARHGLKHYMPDSQYPWPNLTDPKTLTSAFAIAKKYLELSATWNAANEEFIEGTLTMRLRPRIRVGERVSLATFDGDLLEFYVEALSHTFRYPGASTTTLTLTRGIPKMLEGHHHNSAVNRLVLGQLAQVGPTFIGYNPMSGKFSNFGGFDDFKAPEEVPKVVAPQAPIDSTLNKGEIGRLAGLRPEVQAALQQLRAQLRSMGLETHIGSTLRGAIEQAALVASGKSQTQSSWHLLGRAVDLYVIGPDGKIDENGVHEDLYRVIHEQAPTFGFKGYAFNSDWSKRYIKTKAGDIWDAGHLEFTSGLTFAQAQAQA